MLRCAYQFQPFFFLEFAVEGIVLGFACLSVIGGAPQSEWPFIMNLSLLMMIIPPG